MASNSSSEKRPLGSVRPSRRSSPVDAADFRRGSYCRPCSPDYAFIYIIMKILLTTLNSQYIHSNLALRYLYESAGIYRDFLEVKEYTINNDDMSVYIDICRGGYDAVCFSVYIWNVTRIVSLIKSLKKTDPKMKIIVGGPEVSYDPEVFLEKCPETDLILVGEGDTSFPKMLKMLVEGPWEVPADRLLDGGLPDPEDIPFPYENSELDETRIVYYESARGCPFRCSFCLSSESEGVRLLPLERVKKELDFFLEKRVKQVKFIDRTFNIDLERSAEMMEYIIAHDNGVTNFHFELCGDRISEEMLEAFEKARTGLFQVEIGVQSTCDEALAACGRKVDRKKLWRNTRRILEGRNVHVHLDLIAGLPHEGYERFGRSFDEVYGLEPDDLQLGFLKLIRGTRLRREAEQYGYLYREEEPYEVIANDFISAGEIIRLKMLETVLELYFNKPGFRTSLRYLLGASGRTPFGFYTALSEFYYNNGYQESYHKREKLYDIFEEFAGTMGWGDSEELKELLLYDKISTAPPSRFTEKPYVDFVNGWLKKNGPEGERVREALKKINYGSFWYNVEEYARGKAPLRREETPGLLMFFPLEADAGGVARIQRIDLNGGK